MAQSCLVQPPRAAAWLVDLFTYGEQAEWILGDLLEEFSDLASNSGIAFARRWYWRQSVKTIAHLIGTGFRGAPLPTLGTVFAGFLLLVFGASLPERLIVAVIHLRRHHVTPFYDSPGLAAYVLWLNTSILTGRLLMSLFIGCIVATVAKGREIIATMMLCLVRVALTGMGILLLVATHRPEYNFLLPSLVIQFIHSIAIVVGGVIVRESRSAVSRRQLSG